MILMPKRRAKRIPTGGVFQKTYRDRAGKIQKTATWYIKYYVAGNPIEIAAGTEDYDEALTMLRSRMAAAKRFPEHSNEPERVRVGHLLDLLIENYRLQKRKSFHDTQIRVDRHLRPALGDIKVQSLSSTKLRSYVQHRKAQGALAATINKELAWLRRALHLGSREEPPLVLRVPHF